MLLLANLLVHAATARDNHFRADRPRGYRNCVVRRGSVAKSGFNRGGPETPTFVPYHFVAAHGHTIFPTASGLADVNLRQVKPETKQVVADILAQKSGRPLTEDEQRPRRRSINSGLDSLDRME